MILIEAVVLGKLQHKNILHLSGVCLENKLPKMVTSFCAHRDLRNYVRLSSSISTNRLKSLSEGIASGMCYLAENDIVHADLAARNILLDQRYTPKIADFAHAHWPGAIHKRPDPSELSVRWCAPECLERPTETLIWTLAADVWSFGVVLYEIFSRGTRPYDRYTSNEEVMDGVLDESIVLEDPPFAPDKFTYVMRSMCLCRDPEHRATFRSILEHIKAIRI